MYSRKKSSLLAEDLSGCPDRLSGQFFCTKWDQNTDTETEKMELQPAPDFSLYDLDGNKVSLSDKKGKPVIINFWATWCGPCKMEMPYFEEAYKQYGDKIEFMMINPTDGANDTHETVDKFLSETGYTFLVYRDTQRNAAAVYGINLSSVKGVYSCQIKLCTGS